MTRVPVISITRTAAPTRKDATSTYASRARSRVASGTAMHQTDRAADDVACRVRTREPPRARPHRRHARRIVEQPVDLVGEDGQVVAADRGALLEQVVGVPLLLPRDRVHDD